MIPLIYTIDKENLSGTGQMALATTDGLRDHFNPYILAPDSPALKKAGRLGLTAGTFSNALDLVFKLRSFLIKNEELVFMTTTVAHSLAFAALNTFYRRKITHLHIVQGDTDERRSYKRRSKLNNFDLTLIAVSDFVKEKLVACGSEPNRIKVIENFLPSEKIKNTPSRLPFKKNGVKRIIVVSRVEPVNKISLLLEALDLFPALRSLEFLVCGEGSELEALKRRAAKSNPNVTFAGVHKNIEEEMTKSDLLLHLCPVEPFGLTILDALAANVPVLAPDSGAGALISNNVNGFHFRADDAENLAARLHELASAPFDFLNAVAAGGKHLLNIRFSAESGIEKYYRLIAEKKSSTARNLTERRLII